uniref:MADF domain-containing protein n=1 Tax=Amphilophus citrinellus TaxID=61819 RepID=A0A3Q0RV77_AMPCI
MVLINFDFICTGEEVKKRWKNLRDTFMRTRERIWKYFHVMSFLEPYIKERDTSGNLKADDPEGEEGEVVTLTMVPVTEDEDDGAADLLHTTASDTTSDSSTYIQHTAEDEDELYLQSLLPILRRLRGAQKSEKKNYLDDSD